MQTNKPEPKFGFTRYAEIWNGRLAMLGFLALSIDALTGRGILGRLGLF